jgi:hypothetical protein
VAALTISSSSGVLVITCCTHPALLPKSTDTVQPVWLRGLYIGGLGFDRFSQRRSSTIVTPSFTDDQLKRACGGASERALQLLGSVADADEKLAALPEIKQITHGNTDCYLCPKCKFGPIAHLACDDLRAHHGCQGVSNMPQVRQGFLSRHISEWIRIAEQGASTLQNPRLGG